MGRLTERDKHEQGIWVDTQENGDLNKWVEPFEDIYPAINKLAHYEDLEEQLMESAEIDIDSMVGEFMHYYNLQKENRLIELPCAVGDTVYEIPSKVNYELNILNKLEEQNRVYNQKIKEIIFTKRGWYVTCDKYEEYGIGSVLLGEEFGETWFLTKEEAEAKLKELEGDK